MQINQAVIYRLFASTNNPKRSLKTRLALSFFVLAFFGWLSWHTTAIVSSPFGYGGVALCVATTYTFAVIVYVVSDAAHKVFLQKLRPFHYLPIRDSVLRRMQLIAYVPVTVGGAGLIIPAIYAYCSWLPPGTRMSVSIGTFGVVAAAQALMRTAGGWMERWVQIISYVSLSIGLAACWALAQPGSNHVWGLVIYAAVLAYALIAWSVARHRPRPAGIGSAKNVREWDRPGIIGGFAVRALRMWRYRGANVILGVLFLGLSVYASQRQSIPFDAVALLGLLLCGTLGQEARAVSRTQYPIELVMYGQLISWLRGVWALAFANAAIFVEIVLITGMMLFPNDIGGSYRHIVCVGLGMTAIGLMAGSCIVSSRDDVLAQLASTALYGGVAYGFLRLLSVYQRYDSIVVAIVLCLCAALSYAIERMRWRRTIRGNYASLF
jgi:hypothetical protein